MKFTVIGEGTADVRYAARCLCGWAYASWSPSEVVKAYDGHAATCLKVEAVTSC